MGWGQQQLKDKYEINRSSGESLCKDEFQALLRPVREVAIMAGALLPGDASPSIVEAALELEEEMVLLNCFCFHR